MMQDAHEINNPDDMMDDQTQQATQSTQHSSQANGDVNAHLWGFLQPCGPQLKRIDFFRCSPVVNIGRHATENDIVLPGGKVSNRHCSIKWDGKESDKSAVTVSDLSSNGTWINGVRIGKGSSAILKEGNEIAFGTPQPQPGSLEDYRFIYRHTAGGPPQGGVHAFYDISHELGKGSFATVMKAISRATGQWFAIKMIQENKVRRAGATENKSNGEGAEKEKDGAFMREIAILETLDHPNICKLKEVFREGPSIDLVLEFVDGGDLLDFILKHNGLQEGMAIHITKQLCEALAYIHGKGIAHRDLKPENVLLTSDYPPVVKVADFGLAKVVDSATFLKTMCGTPSYLAPEVVMQANESGYSHLVDSWSVGVIVFSMLTISSPFVEDENQRDIKVRIANRTIDWSTLDQAGVSELAKDFIRQLLEFDPRRRLSLSAARHHPWLTQLVPGINNPRGLSADASLVSLGPAGSSLTSLPDDDDHSMIDDTNSDPVMNSGLQQLQLNQSPQEKSKVNANGLPLKRRSLVIIEADEHGIELPEPSWQMLNAAGALPGQRNGKRKLNEHEQQLSALIEDEENGVSATPGGARKRGKQAMSDVESSPERGAPTAPRGPPPQRGRGGRGRGKGRASAQSHIEDEVEPLKQPRRSSRQSSPTKAGRRG
ncbi:hypothetical protein HYDPIDRAFT_165764 [Hydnomerulius pinastri MD-312]|nr:hypothetical protein HYDPIDRAFT_165764 [Hydnomerulius pinastri MD-312]